MTTTNPDHSRCIRQSMRPRLRLAALLLCAVAVTPAAQAGEQKPAGLPVEVGIDPQFGKQIPLELSFRDHQNREVRLAEFFEGDKPVLLNLAYFQCPMLCNMVNDGLLRALTTMEFTPGREFTLLTISFDPREGPPEASAARESSLARYGRDEAAAGWRFLTGDEPSIRRLTEAVGFRYSYDQARGQYAHAAGLFVLTPDGKVSHYLNGVQFSARDLRLSLVEASDHEVGTAADYVLLLCYAYDPTHGRYGMAIMTALRAGGAATVLGMIVGFIWLVRRRKPMFEDQPISEPERAGAGAPRQD